MAYVLPGILQLCGQFLERSSIIFFLLQSFFFLLKIEFQPRSHEQIEIVSTICWCLVIGFMFSSLKYFQLLSLSLDYNDKHTLQKMKQKQINSNNKRNKNRLRFNNFLLLICPLWAKRFQNYWRVVPIFNEKRVMIVSSKETTWVSKYFFFATEVFISSVLFFSFFLFVIFHNSNCYPSIVKRKMWTHRHLFSFIASKKQRKKKRKKIKQIWNWPKTKIDFDFCVRLTVPCNRRCVISFFSEISSHASSHTNDECFDVIWFLNFLFIFIHHINFEAWVNEIHFLNRSKTKEK